MADNVHVHNPPSNGGSGGGPGWIVALVAVVLLVLLVWFFFMRGGADTGPNLPDEIEVDVNTPGATGGGTGGML